MKHELRGNCNKNLNKNKKLVSKYYSPDNTKQFKKLLNLIMILSNSKVKVKFQSLV